MPLISAAGPSSFPDCLAIGVPGEGTYNWEESKDADEQRAPAHAHDRSTAQTPTPP